MTPTGAGSVSQWIGDLRNGDSEEAARHLCDRYFQQLAHLARIKHRGLFCGISDEEDAALFALDSVFRGISLGAFEHLKNRDDFWRLLVLITARTASNQARRERQEKRGSGRVISECCLNEAFKDGESGLDQIIGDEPTPEFAAMVAEEYRRRLESLSSEIYRRIAMLRLEGYLNEEIAIKLNISLRSVERKVETIRKHWIQEISVN